MSAILSIDQSTSATKALLFDTQGQVIDQFSLEHRQIYPRPGWVEHDPEEIYRNTLAAIRGLLDRQPVIPGPAALPEHHQPARDRGCFRERQRAPLISTPSSGSAGAAPRFVKNWFRLAMTISSIVKPV